MKTNRETLCDAPGCKYTSNPRKYGRNVCGYHKEWNPNGKLQRDSETGGLKTALKVASKPLIPRDISEEEVEMMGINLNQRQMNVLAERGFTIEQARAISEKERVSLNGKETAKYMKDDLKDTYPDTVFSVSSDYNSIRAHWKGGPTQKEISNFMKGYSSGGFDGMTDSTYYLPATIVDTPDGPAPGSYQAQYTNAMRTPDFANARALAAEMGEPNLRSLDQGFCAGCGANMYSSNDEAYHIEEAQSPNDMACGRICAGLVKEQNGVLPKNPEPPHRPSNLTSMKQVKDLFQPGAEVEMEPTFVPKGYRGVPQGTKIKGKVISKNSTGVRIQWEGQTRSQTIEWPAKYETEFTGENKFRMNQGSREMEFSF